MLFGPRLRRIAAAITCLVGSSVALAQYPNDSMNFIDANFDRDTAGAAPREWSVTAQNQPGSFAGVSDLAALTGTQSIELRTTGKLAGSSNLRRVDLASIIPISGSIQCSFSVRLTHNTNQQFRMMLSTSDLHTIGKMQIVFKNGSIYAQYGDMVVQQQLVYAGYSANQWYDVLLQVSPATSSYSISVFSGGTMLGQAVDLPNPFAVQPAGLFFGNDGGLTSAYETSAFVDNIVLASTPNPNLSFEADANGAAPTNWTTATQWATGSSVLVSSAQAAAGLNSVELKTQASSANVPAGKNPSSTLTGAGQSAYLPPSADYTCSYNIRLGNTDQGCRFYWLDSEYKGQGNFLVWFRNDGTARVYHQLANLSTNTSTQLLSSYSANTWYKVVLSRPANQDKFSISVYQGGNLLVSLTDLPNKFSYPTETLRFYADGTASGITGERNVYIDDLRMSGPRPTPRQIYVATTGNDNNPGTVDLPYRTFYKGCYVARPGDTVNVAPGTYTETKNTIFQQKFGLATATAPIVVKSTSPQQAIISYSSPALRQKIVIMQNYLTIQDFELTEAAPEPGVLTDILVYVDKFSTFCSILGNKVHGCNEVCIKAYYTPGLTVSNNICYDTTHEGIDTVNVRDLTISGNTVYQVQRNGILTKGGSRSVRIFNNYVHTGSAPMVGGIVLGGTTITASAYDTSTSGYECFNAVAYNNVVVSDTAGQMEKGICIIGGRNASVLHNVIVGPQAGIYLGQAFGDITNGWAWEPLVKDAQIQNNIFQDCTVEAVKLSSPSPIQGSYTNSYNIYYNCTNYANVPGGNLQSDPLFVNPLSDWYFQQGSPGRDSGSYVATVPGFYGETFDVSKDAGGTQRLSPPDMGIWEQ